MSMYAILLLIIYNIPLSQAQAQPYSDILTELLAELSKLPNLPADVPTELTECQFDYSCILEIVQNLDLSSCDICPALLANLISTTEGIPTDLTTEQQTSDVTFLQSDTSEPTELVTSISDVTDADKLESDKTEPPENGQFVTDNQNLDFEPTNPTQYNYDVTELTEENSSGEFDFTSTELPYEDGELTSQVTQSKQTVIYTHQSEDTTTSEEQNSDSTEFQKIISNPTSPVSMTGELDNGGATYSTSVTAPMVQSSERTDSGNDNYDGEVTTPRNSVKNSTQSTLTADEVSTLTDNDYSSSEFLATWPTISSNDNSNETEVDSNGSGEEDYDHTDVSKSYFTHPVTTSSVSHPVTTPIGYETSKRIIALFPNCSTIEEITTKYLNGSITIQNITVDSECTTSSSGSFITTSSTLNLSPSSKSIGNIEVSTLGDFPTTRKWANSTTTASIDIDGSCPVNIFDRSSGNLYTSNGSTIWHTCSTGYSFLSATSYKIYECDETLSEWIGFTNDTCKPVYCSKLNLNLENAALPVTTDPVLISSQQFGSNVIHTCRPNFNFPSGEPLRIYTCMQNGLWTSNLNDNSFCTEAN